MSYKRRPLRCPKHPFYPEPLKKWAVKLHYYFQKYFKPLKFGTLNSMYTCK